MTISVRTLLDQLAKIADHVDPNTPVRINGEYVNELAVTVQYPILERSNSFGMTERRRDDRRSQVINLDSNGREPPDLEIHRFPDAPSRS